MDDARLVLVAHDLARVNNSFDQILELEPPGRLCEIGAGGAAILAEAVTDHAAGCCKGPLAVFEVAALGEAFRIGLRGCGQHLLDRPRSAGAFRLRQRRRRIGLPCAQRLEGQLFVFGEPGQALVFDVGKKFPVAVAAGPFAGPPEPVVVALAVGERPGGLVVHGPQGVGVVDLHEVGTLFERGTDRFSIACVPLDEPAEILLAGREVGGAGRRARRPEEANEFRDDAG